MNMNFEGRLQEHLQRNFHMDRDKARNLIKDHSDYVREAEKKGSSVIAVAAEMLDRSGLR